MNAPLNPVQTGLQTVLILPHLDPGAGRRVLELPQGLTLAEIVAAALPGMGPEDHGHIRLQLATEAGSAPVLPEAWRHVRPRPGVTVVLRVVPGRGGLGSILSLIVSVAAVSLGQVWAPALANATGLGVKFAGGLITAGASIAGAMLVNALVPVPQPKERETTPSYAISGWKNEQRPDAPLPDLHGQLRYAMPWICPPYMEIVGRRLHYRGVLTAGAGRVKFSELRIGQTPFEDYDELIVETREGVAGDEPIYLYPRQVLEEATNIELTRPYPRDDQNEIIDGSDPEETPVERWTAVESWGCTVIIGLPRGLGKFDDEGDIQSQDVQIRIRTRQEGGEYVEVTTLDIRDNTDEVIYASHTWVFPARGRWQVEVTRMTGERTNPRTLDTTQLVAIQSIRPEHPINSPVPLALVGLKIRATAQLNGSLDQITAICERYGRHWNGVAWSDDTLSSNPAAAFLRLLQGPQNPFPAPDAEIDLDQIADWYSWCVAQGLHFDDVFEEAQSFGEALATVCRAGRATWRHDGVRWGVVIDRPQEISVDHLSPRNAAELSARGSYIDPPHAFRARFRDASNDYEWAERECIWPGYEGDVTLTEMIDLPGKTDPAEVWRELRRLQLVLIYRDEDIPVVQSGRAQVATRGDQVMLSSDVLDVRQRAARVTRIEGALVELDELLEMAPGTDYALLFRSYADAEDVLGQTTIRHLVWRAGPSRLVQLVDPLDLPAVRPTLGELVHFGAVGAVSAAMIIKGVSAGEGDTRVLSLVAAAPEIDAILAETEIPDWSGRIGTILEGSMTPLAPLYVSIRSDPVPIYETIDEGEGSSHTEITGYRYTVTVTLAPDPREFALLQGWQVDWRLGPLDPWNETWSSDTPPAPDEIEWLYDLVSTPTDSSIVIDSPEFELSDTVTIRARAIAIDTTPGPYADLRAIVIGSGEQLPAAIAEARIAITPDLGHVRVALDTPGDLALRQVQIYRAPTGATLNRETHLAGLPWVVTPGVSAERIDGDPTRANVMAAPSFGIASPWTAGDGWTIAAGVATHAAGLAGALSQAEALTPGTWYRWQVLVAGRTAGTLTPRLAGGIDQDGTPISANGLASGRILAVTGNAALALVASADFDGAIDDVVLWAETDRSLPIGDFDYYLEPQRSNGWPGPVTGPIPVTIL